MNTVDWSTVQHAPSVAAEVAPSKLRLAWAVTCEHVCQSASSGRADRENQRLTYKTVCSQFPVSSFA